MIIKPKWRITTVLFLLAVSLHAQTAAELDTLLETDAVCAAVAARFVLEAAEILPPGLSGGEAETAAFELAVSKGWIKGSASDNATLKSTAFLVMKAFNLKGGLMYSIFKNPRYAYREMVYRKIIQERSDPAQAVSGPRLLRIIDRASVYAGKVFGIDDDTGGAG